MASASGLTVRSALNPALWMCGIVSVPSACIAALVPEPRWWLIALAVTPVAMTTIGFLYLLLFDRDRLQSENYQIRKQTLELIEQKGDLAPIEATTIEVIANPDFPRLSAPAEGENR
jgi:hypothetical protein